MPRYVIEFSSKADRQLRKTPRFAQKRLGAAIDSLSVNPLLGTARQPHDRQDLWRIRVGAYRIVYTIQDDRLVVLVVALGHRRDVYRGS